jgi:MoaA/NifB/PqqE/SkfB family radical SAM enzyme
MIDLNSVRIVHVEASSRCNSHCPMCSRYTADGNVQPDLVEEDLTTETFYKLFTKEFTSQLEHVYFSGVYGDPCLNKNLPEFVNYLMDNGCQSISIDTNGGYRNEDWWAKLARTGVLINFALDGASVNTLNQYRINVNYDKVIANLSSYVKAGGIAQWNFIVFKHNEHEVETARQLAKDLGVEFRIKVTQKFRQNKNHKVMVFGKHVNTLEPPVEQQYRHPNIGSKEHTPQTTFKFKLTKYSHLNENKISCKTVERKDIFLSASGLLMPCCYLGTYTHDSPGSYQFRQLYDLSKFDLKTNTAEQVLDYFKNISDKWNTTVEDGNLITCLQTCGNSKSHTLYYSNDLTRQTITGEKHE